MHNLIMRVRRRTHQNHLDRPVWVIPPLDTDEDDALLATLRFNGICELFKVVAGKVAKPFASNVVDRRQSKFDYSLSYEGDPTYHGEDFTFLPKQVAEKQVAAGRHLPS